MNKIVLTFLSVSAIVSGGTTGFVLSTQNIPKHAVKNVAVVTPLIQPLSDQPGAVNSSSDSLKSDYRFDTSSSKSDLSPEAVYLQSLRETDLKAEEASKLVDQISAKRTKAFKQKSDRLKADPLIDQTKKLEKLTLFLKQSQKERPSNQKVKKALEKIQKFNQGLPGSQG